MLNRLCIAAAVAVLAGCAPGPEVIRADGTMRDVASVTVRNTVWQDELGLAEPRRIHPGTGPLGQALVDARQQANRWRDTYRIIGPLFAAIDDVDVRGQLEHAIERGVRAGAANASVRVTTSPRLMEAPELDKVRASLPAGGAFLDIVTTYELSLNSLRIEMHSRAALYRAGSAAPVYANRYYYQSAPVSGSVSAHVLWANNHGEKYRQAIAEATDQIARMIALDLSHADTPSPAMRMTFALRNGDEKAPPVTGVVLQERDGRVILRADSGTLHSFAK